MQLVRQFRGELLKLSLKLLKTDVASIIVTNY